MLEHANQGGLLAFQRGSEQLKGRKADANLSKRPRGSMAPSSSVSTRPRISCAERMERAALGIGSGLNFRTAAGADIRKRDCWKRCKPDCGRSAVRC